MGPGILDVLFEYWPIFLKGAIGTLRYAFIAVSLGSLLGALIALMHLSKSKILSEDETLNQCCSCEIFW